MHYTGAIVWNPQEKGTCLSCCKFIPGPFPYFNASQRTKNLSPLPFRSSFGLLSVIGFRWIANYTWKQNLNRCNALGRLINAAGKHKFSCKVSLPFSGEAAGVAGRSFVMHENQLQQGALVRAASRCGLHHSSITPPRVLLESSANPLKHWLQRSAKIFYWGKWILKRIIIIKINK